MHAIYLFPFLYIRCKAARVRGVWQGVLAQNAVEAASAHALGRAAVRVPALRQAVC